MAKIHKPKTIQEAIDDLQVFLECDLYTKFRPAQHLPIGKNGTNKILYRQDVFKSEREFLIYINEHFKILKEQVKKLEKKK